MSFVTLAWTLEFPRLGQSSYLLDLLVAGSAIVAHHLPLQQEFPILLLAELQASVEVDVFRLRFPKAVSESPPDLDGIPAQCLGQKPTPRHLGTSP